MKIRRERALQPAQRFVGLSVSQHGDHEAREGDEYAQPFRRQLGAPRNEVERETRGDRQNDERGDHRAAPISAKYAKNAAAPNANTNA